jgi:transcriptional regulator with XRE-family HTH domain
MDLDKNLDKTSFGQILLRERKKRGYSLQKLAEEIEKVKGKDEAVTSSYLNKLEKSDKANPSFKVVWYLTEILNLDFSEVLNSFGCNDTKVSESKLNNLDQFIRVSDIKAPLYYEGVEPPEIASLTSIEKEMIIRLINDIFVFSVVDSDNVMYALKNLIGDLDDYRKNRMITAEKMFPIEEN